MRPFRKATIKEVAARSGVSTTTVSNFVSGHKNVCSPETAERIRKAIADVVKEGKVRTYDMMRLPGGSKSISQGAASTVQMTDAILEKLK